MRLVDSFGREITDLRISLTNRCNLDCFYCHNEGLGDKRGPREPQDSEMETHEVLRIARIGHELGIRNYKLTGGEPMLRDDLEEIVKGIAELEDTEVSMTTNGVFLEERADRLEENGLERVNISMDTPDPEKFREITRGGINRVYKGIDSAVKAGLTPVKINMVMAKPMRPFLDDMIEFVSRRDSLTLQIIEYMPEIAGNSDIRVDMDEIKENLAERADEIKTREMHHRKKFIIDGTTVEVVDPVENPEFCANCHRIRVTHDGRLKGCLNRCDNLIPAVSTTDQEMKEAFRKVVEERVPYYGEYMIKDEDGNWMKNPKYRDVETDVPKPR